MAQLELSTGNTLNYELIEPDNNGKTFVFFNALSGDKDMWATSVGDALKSAGHGMLLYNLRGQAGSETTQTAIDVASIVEDAKTLLAHVKPARPVHVGLSIGGLFSLAAHLAGGHGRADGIVLINTLRKVGARLDWVNDAVVHATETGGFDLMKDLYSPLLMNIEWQAQNRAQFLGNASYTPCAPDDRALMLLKSGATADWNVNYEAIDVPVLAISGLQDRVFLNEADVTELDALRKQMAAASGEKVSFLPFVCSAVARVLSGQFGALNATVDEAASEIVQHRSVHMGIATDTENGLMVPVIRDCDRLGVLQIGREIGGIASAARQRSIPREQLMGSTFTISNVGSHAGRFATPVINAPEVGILAVGRTHEGMIVKGGWFRAGKLMPLSLACDHRVVDGATAALALAEIVQLLQNPSQLLTPARA